MADVGADARDTLDDISIKSTQAIKLMRLKLSKRRLSKVLYKLIRFTYFIFTRISRTAYCMYSHIPGYTKAVLDGKNSTVQCFNEGKSTTVALIKEVKKSIEEVKQSAIECKKSVKKCLNGKVVSCLMNIDKIANEIRESRSNLRSAVALTIENAPDIVARFEDCEEDSFQKMVYDLNIVLHNMVKCIGYLKL